MPSMHILGNRYLTIKLIFKVQYDYIEGTTEDVPLDDEDPIDEETRSASCSK